jgi:hypothetical protein
MRQRLISGLLVAATLALPGAAVAGSKGRKNTAMVLTGVAAHQLLTGKTTRGVVAGAGAAYAWKRHRDSRKAEKRRARAARLYRTRRYARSSSRYRSRYR